MNKLFIVLLLFAILLSCSRGDKSSRVTPGEGSSTASVPAGAPEIVSASLYPEKITPTKQIIAQYKFRDVEARGLTLTIRWFVDNELVQEGPLATLDPGKYRKGSEVYAEIVAANARGTGKPVRSKPVTVGNLPPSLSTVSLSPMDPPVGAKIIAAATGTDPDGDTVSFLYQWFVNGKPASEPRKDNNEFSTANLRKKDMVHVVVTPTDGTDIGAIKASDVAVLANSAPRITSTPQYALENGWYQYQVTANDPDGDALTYSLLTSPPGMTIDRATGLVRWEAPKTVPEKQEIVIKIAVDDGDGGTANQNYSLFLELK